MRVPRVHGRPVSGTMRPLAPAAAALLGIAGCTGGSGGDSEDSELTIIRSPGGQFQPLFLAQEQGYFDDAGLDVTFTEDSGDPSANPPKLLNDQAQFSMLDGPTLLQAVQKGLPVSTVGGVLRSEPDSPHESGIVVPPDSPIDSLEELAGKKVATPTLSGLPMLANKLAIREADVDPSSVDFVKLPLNSLRDAVSSGEADAFLTFSSFYQDAINDDFTDLSPSIGELLPGSSAVLFAASDEYLAENADVARKFQQVMEKAYDYADENPDETRRVLAEHSELSEDYVEEHEPDDFSLKIDPDGMSNLADVMVSFDRIDEAPDMSDVIWEDTPRT